MALVRNFTHDGTNYPEAYSRIDAVRVTATDSSIGVLTYSDFASRQREENPVWTELFWVPSATVSHGVFPAAYAYVKTQPGFENAIDHENPPEAPAVIDTTADVVSNDFIN